MVGPQLEPSGDDRVIFWLRVSAVTTFGALFALVGISAVFLDRFPLPEPVWTVAMLPPLVAMLKRWNPETRHVDHTYTVISAGGLYGIVSASMGFWVALAINISTIVLALAAPRRRNA
jgi:hypothetical protein